jgi:hypothetical protein
MNLEDFVNWLNDFDASWKPFLFLRPEKDEPMGEGRVAALSIIYGLAAGLFTDIIVAASGQSARVNPLAFPILVTFGFFLIYRFTFAHFWNQRAFRLARIAPSPRENRSRHSSRRRG